MEKISIAKLLKNCPKGMELDCTVYEDVYFDYVDAMNIIHCYIQHETHKTSITLNQYGTPNSDIKSKCVIFPKGKTTWEGFVPSCQFKDGDILYMHASNSWIFIYREGGEKENICYKYVAITEAAERLHFVHDSFPLCHLNLSKVKEIRHATEEEKQKLFQEIKNKGYKWNEDTKTLEKLVESKEDTNDEVVVAGIYFNRGHYSDEVELHLGNYDIEVRDGKTYAIFKNKETKESKPKFKVGDKIRHKTTNKNDIYEISKVYDDSYVLVGFACMICMKLGNQDDWELVPDKFDITTLKPFDKVLVRTDNSFWRIGFFEKIEKKNKRYPFVCMGHNKYSQCIPYEGNEHLLGTTDDYDECFKTWE